VRIQHSLFGLTGANGGERDSPGVCGERGASAAVNRTPAVWGPWEWQWPWTPWCHSSTCAARSRPEVFGGLQVGVRPEPPGDFLAMVAPWTKAHEPWWDDQSGICENKYFMMMTFFSMPFVLHVSIWPMPWGIHVLPYPWWLSWYFGLLEWNKTWVGDFGLQTWIFSFPGPPPAAARSRPEPPGTARKVFGVGDRRCLAPSNGKWRSK
jgi:hypothetical protein